ncbi:MAG: thiol:disulfide interchange protein DsbA/DsbL [Proteobacteria bacterium]|nr:thiol:disulfide interchange protein DsbA/DsbL [Pseudomonadota bacterium]
MRLLARLLTAFSLAFAVTGALATPDNPQPGKDYLVLDQPQSTDAGKKVEVTEFFGYFCPHCNVFEPKLEAWVKKQGDHIVFKRIPVIFNDAMVPQQKLYFALEAMGKADEMQRKVFRYMHVDRQPLNTEEQITDFVGKNGIDKKKFAEVYNSFAVQTKVNRVPQLQQAYQLNGVPTIAIAGRYLTSPSIVAESLGGRQPEGLLQDGALKVMDMLVTKAAKDDAKPEEKKKK